MPVSSGVGIFLQIISAFITENISAFVAKNYD